MELLTKENYNERMRDRSFVDFLNAQPHPVKEMDDSSYTYYDYILYKTKHHERVVQRVLDEINGVIAGTGEIKQWNKFPKK